MVTAQLNAPTLAWALYAQRDEISLEHAASVIRWLGLRSLDLREHRSLSH